MPCCFNVARIASETDLKCGNGAVCAEGIAVQRRDFLRRCSAGARADAKLDIAAPYARAAAWGWRFNCQNEGVADIGGEARFERVGHALGAYCPE